MNNTIKAAKQMGLQYNVTLQVVDNTTGKVVQEHVGHNCATNSMLYGVAHHLVGDSIWNQGWYMMQQYVPKYISLGTMGLCTQEADPNGLPIGIGPSTGSEADRFTTYMDERPGYGADGYDAHLNNNRPYFGLGPTFDNRESDETINCELISGSYARFPITFRDIIPETQSELPKTIDIVYSAMISTGALKQFRGDNDYIFITEAGLWSEKYWIGDAADPSANPGENGLLAAYRLAPKDQSKWDMTNSENRDLLKRSILRVGLNQVVVVVWKIQLGSIDEFGGRLHEYRHVEEFAW